MSAVDFLNDNDPYGGRNATPPPASAGRNATYTYYLPGGGTTTTQPYYNGQPIAPSRVSGLNISPDSPTDPDPFGIKARFAQNPPKTSSGGGAPGSLPWVQQYLQQFQSTDDPNYWAGVIAKDPKVAAGDQSAIDYWINRMRIGDGALAVRQGLLSKFQDGPSGGGGNQPQGGGGSNLAGNANVFNDPATQEWEKLLRGVVDKLNTPQPTWTPNQMDLMQTQAIDPLERLRSQQKQQEVQKLAARGITPTSGLWDQAMRDIDTQFNQYRTQTQANFATQGVNRDDQLYLNNLQNNVNAVNLFKQIPQYADTRLQLANQTLMPTNPAALLGIQQNYAQTANQNSQYQQAQNQQFYGQIANLLYNYFQGR